MQPVRLFTAALVLAAAALPAFSQAPDYVDKPDLPVGVRGELISTLIDAANRDDAAVIEALVDRTFASSFKSAVPMSVHVNAFRGVYAQTGGIDFHSIRHYTPPRDPVVVIVRDRLYGGWHGIEIGFDADDRIAGIQFMPARTPSNVEPTPLDDASLVAAVRDAVERGCERDAFSGAVLVAKGDDVLYEGACGEASKAYGVPNHVDTRFNLGSMNKMFTAVAVMQLVEAGRIGLDDPISAYVDESWLPSSVTERVTVRHLLSHTSGLGSYFNDAFMRSSRALYRAVDDYKPLVQGDTLAFEPGTRFRYSNTGMLLLGVVIESVTGQSYFDYVREHIYVPAGMTGTDSYSLDRPIPNLAVGYIRDAESEYGWRNNVFEHVMRGGPAGGGYSTVRDLHRFGTALRSGRLVSETQLQTMWQRQSNEAYGFGFMVSAGPAGKVVGHGGGFPGINSNLDLLLDAGYTVVVLSNYDRAASPLADHIRSLLGRVADS